MPEARGLHPGQQTTLVRFGQAGEGRRQLLASRHLPTSFRKVCSTLSILCRLGFAHAYRDGKHALVQFLLTARTLPSRSSPIGLPTFVHSEVTALSRTVEVFPGNAGYAEFGRLCWAGPFELFPFFMPIYLGTPLLALGSLPGHAPTQSARDSPSQSATSPLSGELGTFPQLWEPCASHFDRCR